MVLIRWISTVCLMAHCMPLFAMSSGASVIEGRVPLPASPPPAVMAQRYEIVSRGGTLSTIPPVGVVWLEGDFAPVKEPPTRRMVQKDFTFEPALLVIPAGTRVEFPNEDNEYHNVFSYSPTQRFDLGRYMPEERPIPSQVFDVPGSVTVRCDIHEHMRAIILVLDTPHFTMTDTDGRFRLEGLPEGVFTLKAWINSRQTLEKIVHIKGGEASRIDFR